MTGDSPAEALLRSLGVAQPADIDLEAIAWSVGAKVRDAVLESCEARIIGYRDRAIITVQQGGDRVVGGFRSGTKSDIGPTIAAAPRSVGRARSVIPVRPASSSAKPTASPPIC